MLPGEEGCGAGKRASFLKGSLGIHFLGALSQCPLRFPVHLGTSVGVRGAEGLRVACWTQGSHNSSRLLAVLLTLDRPSRNPESVILGEDTQQKEGLADEWKQTSSRSHFSPTYSHSILPFPTPGPCPVVSTPVLSLLPSLPSSATPELSSPDPARLRGSTDPGATARPPIPVP